ncbi:MAG: hypothetical protein MUE37_03350 [Bacteroidales bacterium]|jgi:hypothetical protein|nr:hypothetical protein [Bacteroidales bacterium]
MKKIPSLILLWIILLSVSCEKDKDPVLSDYVIGEWKTPTMYTLSTLPAWFEIEISSAKYSLLKTNGTNSVAWPNKTYSVSNANKTITIKTLEVDPSDIIYKVTLTEDPGMMIWTSDEEGGETFIWEKQ